DHPTPGRTLVVDVTDVHGNGLGPADVPAEFSVLAAVDNPFAGLDTLVNGVTFHDFDGDGDEDALGLSPLFPTGSKVFLLDPPGHFVAAPDAANPFANVQFGLDSRAMFADFDGDGDGDLAGGPAAATQGAGRN